MTIPCVLTVDERNPHSPFRQERLCIEGVMYRGVFDYMQTNNQEQHLLEAMMAKYTQHIYLQKVFCDGHDNAVRLVHVRRDDHPAWMAFVDDAYDRCREQFRPVTEIAELSRLMPMQEGDADQDWLRRTTYFALAQPACGRDRAVHLSRLWLDKKLHKRRYDPSTEDEIALFDVQGAFEYT